MDRRAVHYLLSNVADLLNLSRNFNALKQQVKKYTHNIFLAYFTEFDILPLAKITMVIYTAWRSSAY
jgi:hypothetical protein